MYFESRYQAGEMLAQSIYDQYRYEDCALVALNDGGVLVGQPIAELLHTFLMMLVTENIEIPGEGLTFGSVSQNGNFTYDGNLSVYERDGYTSEFNGYLQEKKREAFQKINRLVGDGGTVDFSMLNDRNIILVTDGIDNKFSIDAVKDFLKPVRSQRIVIASPVAGTEAVNKLHQAIDELHILDIKGNYIVTKHYYDDNQVPSHEEMIRTINQNILKWR